MDHAEVKFSECQYDNPYQQVLPKRRVFASERYDSEDLLLLRKILTCARILGEEVEAFESVFAEYFGPKCCGGARRLAGLETRLFDRQIPNRHVGMTLHQTSLWRLLRRQPFLRSSLYLAIELGRLLSRKSSSQQDAIDAEFKNEIDPFHYESRLSDQRRFDQQKQLLRSISKSGCFRRGLEIGCAEGLFTEQLEPLCETLVIVDISATALERTRERKQWSRKIEFKQWDLRRDPIEGSYDLIVAAGVLEYLVSPIEFKNARDKIVSAICPGGFLLVQSTRVNPVVEGAWWSKYVIRGKRINEYCGRHDDLIPIESISDADYVITLYTKKILNVVD